MRWPVVRYGTGAEGRTAPSDSNVTFSYTGCPGSNVPHFHFVTSNTARNVGDFIRNKSDVCDYLCTKL